VETLAAACGNGSEGGIRGGDRRRLSAALEDAAGVPAVLRAVAAAHRRRGALATGWPFVRWVLRFRPDPLRRLRLRDTPSPAVRTSRPPPSDVQVAQIATAARRVADGASDGLPEPWPRLVREAATAQDEQVADLLDRAVSGADLHVSRPRWWSVASVVQRTLAFAVLAGALWLFALAVLGYLRADEIVPLPEVYGVPIPTWLLLGGAVAGIAFAYVARLANAAGARRRTRAAGRSLRARVEEVGHELIVAPVEAELDVRRRLCQAVGVARGRGRGRR
jgi:hypothetical protein